MSEPQVTRFVCVHGHFYQPPRENPWLEIVEQQDAAYPFHDWNERITAECYAPNTRARVLDAQGRITWLLNNYARISFNVGPTLLGWMHQRAPDTYAAIIEADRASMERFGGHGSAMAQVHSHTILPLADDRDRRTEIRWGIIDFRHHFGREPEGMWLPETAVDLPTLDLLAEQGIAFTVLSPYQAARIRRIGEEAWHPAGHGHVDPRMPYLVRLPSGRSISVFFYDGEIARGVAFEGLLSSSERFAHRLLEGFDDRAEPQLVHVATDGESYGHHHRYGEMGLAATLLRLEEREDVRLTNYAQFLELQPPTHEVEVVPMSSWSCAHGVERWRADCGCGAEAGGRQRWRAPLREALDWLRDELAPHYEQQASELLRDPWAARDDYHHVVLDRQGRLDAFLAEHARGELDAADRTRALQLLELQRHALLMFTSCGWFFEEISRLEPVQVLRYAARALQLAGDLGAPADLEARFVRHLATAPSNDPRFGDARAVWQHRVAPEVVTLDQVAVHIAISGLTWPYGTTERIGAFEVVHEDHHEHVAGRAKASVGRLTIRSVVTHVEARTEFAALHLGDHNFTCGVRPWGDEAAYELLGDEIQRWFDTADFLEVTRTIDEHFPGRTHSLRSLFRDEQRRVLDAVLADSLAETEEAYRAIHRDQAPLMRYLAELGVRIPRALGRAAEVVLNADLDRELSRQAADAGTVQQLLDEAARFEVELDREGLSHTLSATIERMTRTTAGFLASDEDFDEFSPDHEGTLRRIRELIAIVERVPFEVDLAPAQDLLWRTLQRHQVELRARADAGDATAGRWCTELATMADALGIAATELTRPGHTDTVGGAPPPDG
jgi:alpha-amylase/alpha-mannosidase (GH57 family)